MSVISGVFGGTKDLNDSMYVAIHIINIFYLLSTYVSIHIYILSSQSKL